nr:DUF262 domain-containing protein [uncultured Pseudodesulfovibrio sp.]
MKNRSQTIRKIVGYLNNKDEEGGFWLPNIQRPFVWSEEQICKLFDSIMREYPISTLLVWKTNSKIRRRKFIDNWKHSTRLLDFYVPEDESKKCLVLDGQQRLQSLFIGIHGSYEGRELHLNILSGEVMAPDDIKYEFKFLNSNDAQFPWVKFKDVVLSNEKRSALVTKVTSMANEGLSQDDEDKIGDHIDIINQVFKTEDTITYQELDSIDAPELYSEDDVVEVFIRANSGGTKLSKSDLLFSLLSASWELADDNMDDLLKSINKYGFNFDRDFVLKVCLVLLGKGARYEVQKFRNNDVREAIETKWDDISNAIKDVIDFVRSKTFIQCDKALPSHLVLIPLVYARYQYKEAWNKAVDVDRYLVRCLLAGAFSGQSDRLIDAMKKRIDESKGFYIKDAYEIIRSQNRSLEMTQDRFFQMGYGSKTIHLIFNLWYLDFPHTPSYANNLPQTDHIFPQSRLREIKVINPETGRKIMKYYEPERNQLANCMLLSREENGAGGKRDMTPEEWFADKTDEYLDMHLIPKDKSLWSMDRFEEFVEARKTLIQNKFNALLIQV